MMLMICSIGIVSASDNAAEKSSGAIFDRAVSSAASAVKRAPTTKITEIK